MTEPDTPTLGQELDEAVRRLEAGQLVAFPTETVYGLGADARNVDAVGRIFQLKQRPRDHPVIVHLAPGAELLAWARDIPAAARALVDAFWPGPLTLVMKRASGVEDVLTGGQDTVGLRCPAHPLAQSLLTAFARSDARRALAAPSANRYKRVSPTTAQHVRDEFGDAVFILDGGPAEIGIESTILDLSRMDSVGATLLRPGAITVAELADVLGEPPRPADRHAPRASGMLAAHYAPRAPLQLVEAARLAEVPARTAVWCYSVVAPAGATLWWSAPKDPQRYAQQLYAMLRRLDSDSVDAIWIEAPPSDAAWDAVNDRLRRAAHGSASGR